MEEPLPSDARRLRIDEPGRAGTSPTTTLVLGHGRDPASAHALEVAADLAARLRARLEVVHGVDLDDYPIDSDADDWEEQARAALAEQREQVAAALADSGLPWSYHASRADPVQLLAAVAAEHDALIIIVGTRADGFAGTLERLMDRSVSRGILRIQHRPVLVVPEPD